MDAYEMEIWVELSEDDEDYVPMSQEGEYQCLEDVESVFSEHSSSETQKAPDELAGRSEMNHTELEEESANTLDPTLPLLDSPVSTRNSEMNHTELEEESANTLDRTLPLLDFSVPTRNSEMNHTELEEESANTLDRTLPLLDFSVPTRNSEMNHTELEEESANTLDRTLPLLDFSVPTRNSEMNHTELEEESANTLDPTLPLPDSPVSTGSRTSSELVECQDDFIETVSTRVTFPALVFPSKSSTHEPLDESEDPMFDECSRMLDCSLGVHTHTMEHSEETLKSSEELCSDSYFGGNSNWEDNPQVHVNELAHEDVGDHHQGEHVSEDTMLEMDKDLLDISNPTGTEQISTNLAAMVDLRADSTPNKSPTHSKDDSMSPRLVIDFGTKNTTHNQCKGSSVFPSPRGRSTPKKRTNRKQAKDEPLSPIPVIDDKRKSTTKFKNSSISASLKADSTPRKNKTLQKSKGDSVPTSLSKDRSSKATSKDASVSRLRGESPPKKKATLNSKADSASPGMVIESDPHTILPPKKSKDVSVSGLAGTDCTPKAQASRKRGWNRRVIAQQPSHASMEGDLGMAKRERNLDCLLRAYPTESTDGMARLLDACDGSLSRAIDSFRFFVLQMGGPNHLRGQAFHPNTSGAGSLSDRELFEPTDRGRHPTTPSYPAGPWYHHRSPFAHNPVPFYPPGPPPWSVNPLNRPSLGTYHQAPRMWLPPQHWSMCTIPPGPQPPVPLQWTHPGMPPFVPGPNLAGHPIRPPHALQWNNQAMPPFNPAIKSTVQPIRPSQPPQWNNQAMPHLKRAPNSIAHPVRPSQPSQWANHATSPFTSAEPLTDLQSQLTVRGLGPSCRETHVTEHATAESDLTPPTNPPAQPSRERNHQHPAILRSPAPTNTNTSFLFQNDPNDKRSTQPSHLLHSLVSNQSYPDNWSPNTKPLETERRFPPILLRGSALTSNDFPKTTASIESFQTFRRPPNFANAPYETAGGFPETFPFTLPWQETQHSQSQTTVSSSSLQDIYSAPYSCALMQNRMDQFMESSPTQTTQSVLPSTNQPEEFLSTIPMVDPQQDTGCGIDLNLDESSGRSCDDNNDHLVSGVNVAKLNETLTNATETTDEVFAARQLVSNDQTIANRLRSLRAELASRQGPGFNE